MSENIQEEIEDKVIDCINSVAGGRLVIFKPENSGKDLAVEKTSDYKKKAIFLNIYWKDYSVSQDFIEKIRELVVKNNLKPEENFYLLFLNFDFVAQQIKDDLLVVPSLKLKNLAKEGSFSKFLMNKKDFVGFLIDKLYKK